MTNEKQIELMRKLRTRQGFIDHYFSLMPIAKNQKEAYWLTEDLHTTLFGFERYSGYESFKVQLTKHFKK